jgi:hypothetical protein
MGFCATVMIVGSTQIRLGGLAASPARSLIRSWSTTLY